MMKPPYVRPFGVLEFPEDTPLVQRAGGAAGPGAAKDE